MCFASYLMPEKRAVCFVGVIPMAGKVGYRRITRCVTLPDFQGIGIAGRTLQAVCELFRDRKSPISPGQCIRMGIVTGHPAMIRAMANSPVWRCRNVSPMGTPPLGGTSGFRSLYDKMNDRKKIVKTSAGRAVASFEYIGKKT